MVPVVPAAQVQEMPSSLSLEPLKWTTLRAPAACMRNSCSDHHTTSTPLWLAWSSWASMLAVPSLKHEWTCMAIVHGLTGEPSSAKAAGTSTEGAATPPTAPTVAREKPPWMKRRLETGTGLLGSIAARSRIPKTPGVPPDRIVPLSPARVNACHRRTGTFPADASG